MPEYKVFAASGIMINELLTRFASPRTAAAKAATAVAVGLLSGLRVSTRAAAGALSASEQSSSANATVVTTMRCALYDHRFPAGVRIGKCPRPSSDPPSRNGRRPGTILCAVRAAGVNPVDAKYIVGDKFRESFMPRVARLISGVVPGFDFSGVVLDAPEGSGFRPGDEVFGLADDPAKLPFGKFRGSFAEVVEAPLDQVSTKPTGLSHAEAAALPLVGVTALQIFDQHGLKSGQRVLVIGASGGVGHVAVQAAAKGIGADVTAVCSKRNAEWVKGECGAQSVVEYDDGRDVVDLLVAAVNEAGPFDLVVDCVHSADPRDMASSYFAKITGRKDPPIVKQTSSRKKNYVVFGGQTRHWFLAGLKRVTGADLFWGGLELFWIRMPGSTPELQRLADWATDGRMRPHLGRVIPFSEEGVREAFELLRGRRAIGKVVLMMDENAKITRVE